jgi:phospholipid/cholesterol/gamma-HCH transport system ATP-binding protein
MIVGMPEPAIELVDVVKKLGSQRVLDGLDLTVPAGATTVLLGASGAGKTVTIKHILGLMKPTSGTVRVEGKDLTAISEAELYEVRRGMSAMLQGSLPFSCGLFDSLSVYDNVAFGVRERTGWTPERVDAVTRDYLQMVGLGKQADKMPNQLSAGMRKQTALARALALEARIVIIDDLDSGIDSVRLGLLCELIHDAQEDTEATFLVTTHDMKMARKLANYAAVLHEGRIVASGDADEVFGSGDAFVHQLVTGGKSGPLQLRDV